MPAKAFWLLPLMVLILVVGLFLLGSVNKPTSDDFAALPAPGPAPDGMAWIPGGWFIMGDANVQEADAPPHKVGVRGFWIDTHEVTNAEFAKFVIAKKYITIAERTPTKEQFPDVPESKLVAFSAVFQPCACDAKRCDADAGDSASRPWWEAKFGAFWKQPEGPGSSIVGREKHPVVHIAWDDAIAYAKWAGKRLPTEAEWERAARGGLAEQPFTWGSTPQGTDGRYFANTFQGEFPSRDTALDGFTATSPVGTFPANGYGLYDMSGNAWEWCHDWYQRDYYTASSANTNPQGPETGDMQGSQPQKVRRGGSYLCSDDYCKRYVPGARDKNPTDSSACHTGFRCTKDAK